MDWIGRSASGFGAITLVLVSACANGASPNPYGGLHRADVYATIASWLASGSRSTSIASSIRALVSPSIDNLRR